MLELVILWGDAFSSWAGVLQELRLRPVAVILKNFDSLNLVRASVGVDCFVGLAQDVEAILGSLSGKCHLGLVDGRPTRQICQLGERFGLDCIVGTQNIWRGISGWRHDSHSVLHCEVGGVTTIPLLPASVSSTGTSFPCGQRFLPL
jgi:hypothetical protein